MRLTKALIALRDLLFLIREIIIRWEKDRRKKKAEKVIHETKRSQLPLEDHISGTSGRPSRYDYHGMSTRDREPRD